ALLLPMKLWRSLAGGGVRRLLVDEARILAVEDYSEAACGFDAVAYPSLLAAQRVHALGELTASVVALSTVRRGVDRLSWRVTQRSLPFDASPGAPWILLPRGPREAFDLLRSKGIPLAESPIGRPLLGVKCGCNAAFIVRCAAACRDVVEAIGSDARRGEL